MILQVSKYERKSFRNLDRSDYENLIREELLVKILVISVTMTGPDERHIPKLVVCER